MRKERKKKRKVEGGRAVFIGGTHASVSETHFGM